MKKIIALQLQELIKIDKHSQYYEVNVVLSLLLNIARGKETRV